jgi:hypothetical protein
VGKIVIPFPRDRDFVDRTGIIDQITKLLEMKGSPRVALVGFGGVG